MIKLANDTPFGLAAYLYTCAGSSLSVLSSHAECSCVNDACSADTSRQWRVTERLEYGMVGVNQGSVSSPWAPFGGIKESGFGREGSVHGLEDYLQMKCALLSSATVIDAFVAQDHAHFDRQVNRQHCRVAAITVDWQ